MHKDERLESWRFWLEDVKESRDLCMKRGSYNSGSFGTKNISNEKTSTLKLVSRIMEVLA